MRSCSTVVAAVFLSVGATAPAQEPVPHLKAAEQMVRGIQPENNEYRYSDISMKWKGVDGATEYSAHCDCSGFTMLLLQHAYGYTPAQILAWTGHRRPVAKVFFDVMTAERGFRRVKTIDDVRPGDFIAVKYLDDSKDTGHVMLVAEAPSPREASAPVEPETRQWEVTVIDSSKSGHGTNDTRRKADKTFSTGVGRGTLRLYTHRDGEIVGYSWSTGSKSNFQGRENHPLVVGRLVDGFTP